MSHVAKIEVEINDLAALRTACETLGLEFVENQKTYKWYGTSVGDYPLPVGFTEKDLGKCEHAIRVKGHSNAYEIGVCKRRDGNGYTMLWDFWNGGYGLENAVGKNGHKLVQNYVVSASSKQLQKQGYRINTYTKEDGRIFIRATK